MMRLTTDPPCRNLRGHPAWRDFNIIKVELNNLKLAFDIMKPHLNNIKALLNNLHSESPPLLGNSQPSRAHPL